MKKILNFRPVFYLALSSVLGILSAYFYITDKLYIAIILTCISICAVISCIIFSKKNRKQYIIFAVIFIVMFLLSGVNIGVRINSFKEEGIENLELTFTAKIKEIKEYDSLEKLIVKDVSYSGNKSGKLKEKVSLSIYSLTDFDIGDVITFKTSLTKNKLFKSDYFNSNDLTENIKYSATVNLNEVKLIGNDQNIFESVHKFIRDSLKSGLSERSFSIAYALMLGNTGYIESDLLENFRALGVAHIFAVSGLHIGFFATFLALIFSKIKIKGYIKLIVTALILFFYAGVCGFSASSIRASIMTTILLSAELVGKKYDRLSSVGLACIIVLAYAPAELFRVGFQLSFVVVLGMIISGRMMQKPFKFTGQKFSSLLGGVLSAQLFSLPICMITFKEVSLISILANIIILPIIGIFYIVLFVATILGGICTIPDIMLYLPNLVLEGVGWLVNAFDYTMFTVGGVAVGIFAITYYASFVVGAGYFNFKKLTNIIVALIFMFVTVLGCTILTVKKNKAVVSYVIGDGRYCAYVLSADKKGVIIFANVSDDFSPYKIESALNKLSVKEVDSIIFLENDIQTDMISAIFKIENYYTVSNVYYYTDEDKNVAVYLNKLFTHIDFTIADGENLINANGFSFSYFLSGYGVSIDNRGNNIKVVTKLSYEFSDFNKIPEGNTHLLVAYNYHEILSSKLNARETFSFMPYSDLPNGYEDGNLRFEF